MGIIPGVGPAAVYRDRTPMLDGVGELMDRQVRTLARAIHSEEPQADDRNIVEMRVREAHLFRGQLADSVWRDRAIRFIAFSERDPLGQSINGTGRRKDDFPHL